MNRYINLTIDPCNISKWNYLNFEQRQALNDFFQNSKTDTVWHSNKVYEYNYSNIKYTFFFTESLIQRQRKAVDKGPRLEVFNPNRVPIGKGGYGIVYPLTGTIKFIVGVPVLKQGNKKLVKIQNHDEKDQTNAVVNEYQSLLHVGHLDPKQPVFTNDSNGKSSYLIMDEAEGFPLEKILNPEKRIKIAHQLPELTLSKRLELTIAILKAIKEQVTDKNLIHRDIKPGNFIVDLSQSPSKVTVIDYGFAIKQGIQDYLRLGTRAYRAPESFENKPIYTIKSDVYSAGRVLSYLWGDDYDNFYINKYRDLDYVKRKSTNEHLFYLPEIALFLDEQDQRIIRSTINGMMLAKPGYRYSIDEAITSLSSINTDKYKNIEHPNDSQLDLKKINMEFNNQINTIMQHLKIMESNEQELKSRGYYLASKTMKSLRKKIKSSTEFLQLQKHPDESIVLRYRKYCLKEIKIAKTTLEQHRDAKWLLAEISTAIALLGVGYLIALGVNYYLSGQIGLFSKTKSERLADNLKDSILTIAV